MTTELTDEAIPRPRLRASAITWGLIVAATASAVLFIVTVPGRREGFVDWLMSLTAGDFMLIAIGASGAIVLVAGLLSALRSIQGRS